MNDFEQQYLPEAYRPLSPWTYFGLSILYSVPVIGWVFLIDHAVASRNINKRNYARSFFCVYILAAVLILRRRYSSGLVCFSHWNGVKGFGTKKAVARLMDSRRFLFVALCRQQ